MNSNGVHLSEGKRLDCDVVSPTKRKFSPWKHFQGSANRLWRETIESALRGELRQISVATLLGVDRERERERVSSPVGHAVREWSSSLIGGSDRDADNCTSILLPPKVSFSGFSGGSVSRFRSVSFCVWPSVKLWMASAVLLLLLNYLNRKDLNR